MLHLQLSSGERGRSGSGEGAEVVKNSQRLGRSVSRVCNVVCSLNFNLISSSSNSFLALYNRDGIKITDLPELLVSSFGLFVFEFSLKRSSCPKFSEPTYEDCINLVAPVPIVAAYFYRRLR